MESWNESFSPLKCRLKDMFFCHLLKLCGWNDNNRVLWCVLRVWEISLSRLSVCLQGLGILELLCPLGVKYVRDAKPFYSVFGCSSTLQYLTCLLQAKAGILCQNNLDFKIQKLICLNASFIGRRYQTIAIIWEGMEALTARSLATFVATDFKVVFHP